MQCRTFPKKFVLRFNNEYAATYLDSSTQRKLYDIQPYFHQGGEQP